MNQIECDFRAKLPIAKNKGFDPNILLVQAILETRIPGEWFGSELAKLNNFWGIKAWKSKTHGDWKGLITKKDSPEYVGGKLIPVNSGFIICPTITNAFETYLYLIETFHPKSWASRDYYKEYFKNIASWSSSPTYTVDNTNLYEKCEWEGKLVKT